jgi:purine-cytosine permease-like protein
LSSGQTLIGDISKTAIKKASCPRNKMTIWNTTIKPKLTFAIFLFFKNNVLTDEFIFHWFVGMGVDHLVKNHFVESQKVDRKYGGWSLCRQYLWHFGILAMVYYLWLTKPVGGYVTLGQVRKFFKFEFLSRKHFW